MHVYPAFVFRIITLRIKSITQFEMSLTEKLLIREKADRSPNFPTVICGEFCCMTIVGFSRLYNFSR